MLLAKAIDERSTLSFTQVATAIRGAIIQAKMSVVPVRRGYWGNKIGKPHTVPTKVLPLHLHGCGTKLCTACCLQRAGLHDTTMPMHRTVTASVL